MTDHPAHVHPVTRAGAALDDMAAAEKVAAGSGVARAGSMPASGSPSPARGASTTPRPSSA